MITYKELLGTCIKSKKQHIYIYTVCTKSASKNSLNCLFYEILLFRVSRESFLTCTATQSRRHKCPRTNVNLLNT